MKPKKYWFGGFGIILVGGLIFSFLKNDTVNLWAHILIAIGVGGVVSGIIGEMILKWRAVKNKKQVAAEEGIEKEIPFSTVVVEEKVEDEVPFVFRQNGQKMRKPMKESSIADKNQSYHQR